MNLTLLQQRYRNNGKIEVEIQSERERDDSPNVMPPPPERSRARKEAPCYPRPSLSATQDSDNADTGAPYLFTPRTQRSYNIRHISPLSVKFQSSSFDEICRGREQCFMDIFVFSVLQTIRSFRDTRMPITQKRLLGYVFLCQA